MPGSSTCRRTVSGSSLGDAHEQGSIPGCSPRWHWASDSWRCPDRVRRRRQLVPGPARRDQRLRRLRHLHDLRSTARPATITEHATGLAETFNGKPYPHVQHIHIGAKGECPTMSADTNGDGVISTTEGGPFYGGDRRDAVDVGRHQPGGGHHADGRALVVRRSTTAAPSPWTPRRWPRSRAAPASSSCTASTPRRSRRRAGREERPGSRHCRWPRPRRRCAAR